MANSKTFEIILKAIGDFSDVKNNIGVIQKSLNQLKLSPDLKQKFSNIFADLEKQTQKYQEYLNSGFKTKGDVTGLEKTGNRINQLLSQLQAGMNKIDPSILQQSFNIDTTKITELNNQLEQYKAKLTAISNSKEYTEQANEIDKIIGKMSELSKSKYLSEIGSNIKTGNIDEARLALEKLVQKHKEFKDSDKEDVYKGFIDNLREKINKLSQTPDLEQIIQKIKELKKEQGTIQITELEKFVQTFQNGKTAVEGFGQSFRKFSQETEQSAKSVFNLGSEIEQLKHRVTYFFGLTNSVMLLRRALKQAMNTVKELDAVMTETAVVTDFSVGDMWDKLPEYSQQATALGASIKDLYAATTLYYQQGLKSNEAMGVGVETMKMARIAGMEASDATQAMTAALRGFNMEVNETNAIRVNDVYSELAAITAADTEQIATAMSKTASIAASANMEFETTSALLAQIIETTQEAPETAGTAMKTIIARFTEVKELFSQGQLTGEDSEGEEININKIDKALKTVGISLKDFLNGSKGIDDIFLELASKWDSLDLSTQRYIATMAAGSRQQSRFIAMMSNYDRTMELVTAANNSAGASQKQFDKTLESMEAKLQKLKNAWDEFTMGLANNEILKGGVDALTWVIESINKLIDIISGGNNTIKSVLNLITTLGALIAGRKMVGGLFTKGTGLLTKGGLAHFINDLQGAVEIMRDPALRGEGFQMLKTAIKGAGKALGGFLAKWGIWIALAIAVIALIKKIHESFQEAQKSARMEGLQNSLQDLQTELGEAKSELDEITNSKEGLERLEDNFNNLTKGTAAWKQNLIAVNQQVLDLMEKYPSLAEGGFISTGEYGQLTIKEEGWDNLYDQQNQLISNLTASSLSTTARIKELQSAMNFDNFAIESQETELDKNLISFELKTSDWLDSQVKIFGKETKATWGDVVSGISDAMTNALLGPISLFSTNSYSQFNKEIQANGGYAEATAKKITGGLTNEEYTDLAAAFAEVGITFSDGLTDFEREQAQQIYNNFGYDLAIFDQVMAAAEGVGESFDELGAKTMGLAIQQEAATDSFISNAVSSSKKIGNLEYSNAVANLIASTEKYEDLTKRIDEEKIKIKEDTNVNSRMQLYAEKFGKYYADGKLYTDSSMEHQLDLSDDYITEALASANITLEISEQAEKLVSEGLLGKNIKLFDKLFSKEGTELYARDVADYTNNGAIDFEKIAKDMGYVAAEGKTAFANMAAAFDMDSAELEQIINENFKTATDRIAKQRKDLTKKMSKYSQKGQQGYELNAGILSGLELKFGEEIRGTLEDVFNSLDEAGDENLLIAGFEQFKNVAMKGTIEEVQTLKGLIDSIDWSNPIDAAYKLNQEVKNGTAITRKYAQEMLKAGDSFLSAGSQMQYFLKSDQFKEVSENLKEIIENNQEVAASDILNLADDYKSLNKIMENTGVTAGGLAKALQKIQEGKLGVHQLTDAVMASLAGFDSLDSITASTLKTLSEFDPGVDEDEVADFMNSAYETLSENLEKGAVGNSQNFSYLDFLFPGWRDDLEGDALVEKMKQMTKKVKENATNMRRSWSDLADGEDVYGNEITFDENSGRTIDDVIVEDTGEEIILTGYEGMTTNELVTWIADAYNVSENYAKMMLTDFKNYSSDLAQELNKNDYIAGLENAYEKLKSVNYGDIEARSVKQQKIIDESEIEAIATLYNKKIEDVRADFENQGAFITDFYDENGLLIQTSEIMKQLDTIAQQGKVTGAKWSDQFVSIIEENGQKTKVIDIEKINAELANLNIPEEAKAGVTQDIISSIQEGSEQPLQIKTTLSDGKEYTIPITPDIDIQTAISNAEKELENSALAEAIANAFTNVEINPTVKTEDITGGVVAAIKAADGTAVVVVADADSLDQLGVDINTAATSNPPIITMNADVTRIEEKIAQLNERSITISVNYSGNLPKFASGVKNSPFNYGSSLVSEEGPELIQKANGTAYLSGTEGPEIAQINRGDTVYTAEETEDILNRKSKKTIPRYARGYGYGTAYDGSGYDSDSDDSETDKIADAVSEIGEGWKNMYDEFYNIVQKINEEIRKRNKLEHEYQKILDKINTSADDLAENSKKQLESLEAEKKTREGLLENRKKQMEDIESENSKYSDYAHYNEELGVIEIDWEKIEALDGSTDEEFTKGLEEYISQLEDQEKLIEEEEDALDEIEDAVKEIRDQGKDEYFDFENQIRDALEQSRQEEIDKLSAINESINGTNARLLEAMQSSIDKYRQDRENERTEEELSDKQRRLAYLQQDTSGANALEIMQLQKEIEEGQEDYTDTLIDQKISELQEQNDKAAEQRQQQIDIMQAQLDHYIESGEVWQDVYALMDEGINADGGLIRGSDLETLLKDSENFKGMSELGKVKWLEELENNLAEALKWLQIGNSTKALLDSGELKKGQEVTFTTSDGKKVTGTLNEDGSITTKDGKTYKDVYKNYDGTYVTKEKFQEPDPPKPSKPEEPEPEAPKLDENTKKGVSAAIWNGGYGWGYDPDRAKRLKEVFGENDIQKNYVNKNVTSGYSGKLSDYSYENMKKKFKIQAGKAGTTSNIAAFKTGGLADFTGPAWLDGTKSRPEYILNADQTKSFFQLVDVLGSLKSGASQSSQITGDSIYDVDINVESIGSDYDVEQLASTIKRMINDDARYRNNNAINLQR